MIFEDVCRSGAGCLLLACQNLDGSNKLLNAVLNNPNFSKATSAKVFKLLTQSFSSMDAQILQTAVINEKELEVEYMIENYNFGPKFLKRLLECTSNKRIQQILRSFQYKDQNI